VIKDNTEVKKDIVDVITKLEQDEQLEAVVPNDVVVKKRPLSEKDLIKVTLDEPKNQSKKAPLKKQQKAGDYRIQLGAFKTRGDAEKAFDSIKRKNIDVIKNMGFHVQRADLGDKGIFFRLQAGDFTSQQDARKVCAELRERKQGCFIVSVK
ncbi:MAG: SPOR domain-containing protein, partial [Rickettsiales bacterium]|nr:SPOR domain-containing protein [Rickettsiales bacterium]